MLQYTFKIVNALLYTIRPSATIGACILALAAYQPQEFNDPILVPLIAAAFFGGAFCFLVNDLYDREKDILNNKRRPIATGEIPLSVAKLASLIFAVIFIVSAWYLGFHAFILAFGFLLIALTYSFFNSKSGLSANVIVAIMASGTQWGVAIIKPESYLIGSSIFLFFLTVPREVLLDWLDISGDKQAGKKSFPMNHSIKSVNWLIITCLLASTLAMFFATNCSTISTALFVLAIATSWVSFVPFLINAKDKTALKSVRLTHISFAFLILALFTR